MVNVPFNALKTNVKGSQGASSDIPLASGRNPQYILHETSIIVRVHESKISISYPIHLLRQHL
jgi:hypothetical protein